MSVGGGSFNYGGDRSYSVSGYRDDGSPNIAHYSGPSFDRHSDGSAGAAAGGHGGADRVQAVSIPCVPAKIDSYQNRFTVKLVWEIPFGRAADHHRLESVGKALAAIRIAELNEEGACESALNFTREYLGWFEAYLNGKDSRKKRGGGYNPLVHAARLESYGYAKTICEDLQRAIETKKQVVRERAERRAFEQVQVRRAEQERRAALELVPLENHGGHAVVPGILHAVSDAIAVSHAAHLHLPRGAGAVGALAGAAAAMLHDRDRPFVQNLVCNGGVAVLREAVDSGVAGAVGAAAAASVAVGGVVATPLVSVPAGVAYGAAMATATYVAVQPATAPVADQLSRACHSVVELFPTASAGP